MTDGTHRPAMEDDDLCFRCAIHKAAQQAADRMFPYWDKRNRLSQLAAAADLWDLTISQNPTDRELRWFEMNDFPIPNADACERCGNQFQRGVCIECTLRHRNLTPIPNQDWSYA